MHSKDLVPFFLVHKMGMSAYILVKHKMTFFLHFKISEPVLETGLWGLML